MLNRRTIVTGAAGVLVIGTARGQDQERIVVVNAHHTN